ncbi:MAG: DedA family protein [Phocaeicola sp.]
MESVTFFDSFIQWGFESIQWSLDHLNYWTITLLMTIESSFIPFPSEIVVPPAAYRAAAPNSDLHILGVIFFATLGANIGALINYYIAYFVGRPIVYKFANSKFGHMCLINQEKVEHAEHYFEKRGALSTFIGRLIPAVRQLISIPAGLAKMKLPTFLLYTTLGAGIWNTILAIIGYYLYSVVPEDKLLETVTRESHIISYCIMGCVAIFIGFLIYKGRKKKA